MAAKGGVAGPDIFLSYNREDSARAKHFADGFAAEGFEVWWDVALRSGEAYDEVTEAALHEAKAVVVLWSPRSVSSRWVRSEATIAERNKTLVPVTIEPCRRPVMFELIQTAELSHWQGDTGDPAWQDLANRVREIAGNGLAARPVAPSAKPDQTSVVVLPFANMSNDPEQDYFADGMTEDIITDLSKVSALLVIARNTAFTFKGKPVDVADVARQLGVSHVLEGSVRKAGNRIRVTAQLIDGATGGHLWADRWDRDLADIFELQDELSEAIVSVLKVKLLPAEKKAIEVRLTKNAEAYDHYIRARALRAIGGGNNFALAIADYRKAIALDPEFAGAWAGLAGAISNRKHFVDSQTAEELQERDRALARASELAPNSPDVIAALSMKVTSELDWEGMEDCLARWEVHGPATWSVHSGMFLALGRANEACDAQANVCRTDPLSVGASFVYQHMLDCAGRLEEGDTEYRRLLHLPFGGSILPLRAIVRTFLLHGRAAARRQLVEQFGQSDEFGGFPAALAKAFDHPDEARRVLSAALDMPECRNIFAEQVISLFAGAFGDADIAIAALQRCIVDRRGYAADLWNPAFIELRHDPRFKQIVIDIGLADHWRKTGNWGDFARPLGDGDFEIIG